MNFMVVVEYQYNEMKKHVNLSVNEVVDNLSNIGAPSEYDKETGMIVSEITPNRPDWYSVEGLARSLKIYSFGKIPKYSVKKSDYKVVVENSGMPYRPYTVSLVVKGLKLDDQKIKDLVSLQEKLSNTLGRKRKKFGLGFYPLEQIAFPIRYTSMKKEEVFYTPLDFESDLSAQEVLQKHKKGIEYGYIIRDNPKYPVFIDAKNRIMCLIPLVNSALTGKVDVNTKEIFVEVTGTEMNSIEHALNIIACTLSDMGGELYEVTVDYGKTKHKYPNLEAKKMKIDVKKASSLLGIDLTSSEIKKLLEKMGYGLVGSQVLIPPYRADVLDFVDIIEDIAIAYGYNNFKPTMPDFFNAGKVDRTNEKYDNALRGMGFLEIKTFILTNKSKLEAVFNKEKVVEILNPSNEEYTIIRPVVIQEFLEVLSINKTKGLPQKLYEIGLVQKSKTEKRLVFAIMDKKLEFSDVRGYLQTLSYETGNEYVLDKQENQMFEQQTSTRVMNKGRVVGSFGQVKKEVLGKFGIEFDVYVCEMEL